MLGHFDGNTGGSRCFSNTTLAAYKNPLERRLIN